METIRDILSKGDLILRDHVKSFEENLARFVGRKYAVGVSNCTDAMMLALQAAGIGAGDEVITVSHTFVATAAAIHHVGASPVLIDIGEDHNMNVDLIEKAITPKTRAIMPVHLNGRVCQMDKLMPIAEHHGLKVIEDAAQALGGSMNGIRAGAFGLASCFSFYPAKILGTYGDAGAMVTNDEEMAEKVMLLRNHGKMPNGEIACWSFNSRLDNLHAAILDLKLQWVPQWIERRRSFAALYHQLLGDIEYLHLPLPPVGEGPFFDVYQNYEIEAQDQAKLVAHLQHKGVEVMIPWGGKGIHQFASLGLQEYKLPRTEKMFQKALMLPLHPELEGDQIRYVAEMIREFYKE